MDEPLPLLPFRNLILLPGARVTVSVVRPSTSALFRDLQPGAQLVVAAQRDPTQQNPAFSDLHDIAVLAELHSVASGDGKGRRAVLQGLRRVKLAQTTQREPYFRAAVHPLQPQGDEAQASLLAEALRSALDELGASQGAALARNLPPGSSPGLLADQVASLLHLERAQRLEVLKTVDPCQRLRLVADLTGRAHAEAELKAKLQAEIRQAMNKNHRQAILRQQLAAIQRELGKEQGENEEGDALLRKLEEADLPEEVREVVDRETGRLASMERGQPEYNVIRTYLEWLAALPWKESSPPTEDLDEVARILDEDHFGLQEVKKRILEHIAVLKLSGSNRGGILCLAGPPGVGKTSLGESIARATGRRFARISLGGVRDEAEVRGHRRTYVGALPGRIIHAMRKAEVNNPLLLIDEIDKLGRGWAGDPQAALLEVLDPEQNDSFTDHYLELSFDLSKVLFVCTANNLDSMSPPLRDRLEVLELNGYASDEKVEIARRHLLPASLAEHSLAEDKLSISDEALHAIIADHTREAGVRQLKRAITKLCRALALEVARSPEPERVRRHVEIDDLRELLGKKRFFSELAARAAPPGVATGLAWTPVGGDILFIETSQMPGNGKIEITGQLGEVMRESARAALSYLRSNASQLAVDASFLEGSDLHIHVPAGAVPKDGPSAGVTIFTALASLLSGRRVRPDTGMTGECTLRGQVLPVGGIKAKLLAAHRSGLKRVVLPLRNLRDADEVPQAVLDELELIPVEHMSQVLEAVLVDEDEGQLMEKGDVAMDEGAGPQLAA